jgi:hypothetical protein
MKLLRLVALFAAGGLIVAALWTLRGGRDADHDGVADVADRCPGTPRDLAVDAAGCAAAQRAMDKGVEALAQAPAMFNVGSVWVTQQLLRRHPDERLHALVERSIASLAGQPGGRLISPSAAPVDLPADPTRGLLRFNNYVLAAAGVPRDRALTFLTDLLATDESGYIQTHQLLALLWAEDQGFDLPATLRARTAALLARIEAEQRTSPPHFNDLYAERVALLLAFGAPPRTDAVRWVDVVVAAQQADGRWVDVEGSTVSYDGQTAPAVHEWTHTSAFSIVALGMFLDRS